MIDDKQKQKILQRLKAAEAEHNVTILYACESGSRAWGFSSEDSDYDIRFLYAHNKDWYLSFDIEYKRDVIEYEIVDEIDCSGWDIKKALYLFTRTNGALLEWLNSPIRYIERGNFAQDLREFAPKAMNSIALQYHYSHMARGNAQEALFKEELVKLKKYFYVLRPLLALRYIEKYRTPPPVEFEKLLNSVAPKEILPEVNHLLELKRNSPELGKGKAIPSINRFIEKELDHYATTFSGQGRPDLLEKQEVRDTLNTFFREALTEQ
jgi:predicted nucleotidyltransferase